MVLIAAVVQISSNSDTNYVARNETSHNLSLETQMRITTITPKPLSGLPGDRVVRGLSGLPGAPDPLFLTFIGALHKARRRAIKGGMSGFIAGAVQVCNHICLSLLNYLSSSLSLLHSRFLSYVSRVLRNLLLSSMSLPGNFHLSPSRPLCLSPIAGAYSDVAPNHSQLPVPLRCVHGSCHTGALQAGRGLSLLPRAALRPLTGPSSALWRHRG